MRLIRGLEGALVASALLLCTVVALPSRAATSVVFRHHADPTATDRIIVKWRSTGVAAVQIASVADRATRLVSTTGVDVHPVKNLYDRTDVLRLDSTLSRTQMRSVLAQLKADPGVEYAEADSTRYVRDFPADLPDDPYFTSGADSNGTWNGQWYLQASSTTTPAAISATTAWQSLSTIGTGITVAVIDTGVIEDQPDLSANLTGFSAAATPQVFGYDFVSCDQGNSTTSPADCSVSGSSASYDFANDSDGWDDDPADPGDWLDATDVASTLFSNDGCTTVAPSSWHGTKVAGIIGAVANNGVGIAGIAPGAKVLPIRVIGKCSGRVSDIAAAIRWAAGLTVTGVTTNTSYVAKIINLSLGAAEPCSATEQDAITAAIDAGVLVVAAAGNDGGPVNAPGNCTGVLSVAGIRHTGTKVGYSSLSSSDAAVTIAAPAGNCVNTTSTAACIYAIETTTDEGSTSPSGTPGFYTYSLFNSSYSGNTDNAKVVGTSFATPIVSGVAALMLGANPDLSPSQLIARLQAGATTFPTSSSTTSTTCSLAATTTDSNGYYSDTSQNSECICTTATCGAGMLNAYQAVLKAEGMFVEITLSSTTGSPGKHITLDGSGSTAASGHSLVSYQWSTIPTTSDQIINPNASVATLVVPSFRSIQVKLTITDDAGNSTSGTATVQSTLGAATSTGEMDMADLLMLAGLVAWQLRRRLRGR